MTTFTIFVIILTFAYVVYFAVIITLDLHKKKDVQKSDEEVFDISDMNHQEEPTCIKEEVNDENNEVLTYTDEVTEDGIRLLNPSGGILPDSKNSDVVEESPSDSDNDELNEEHDENMEAIDPKAQVSIVSKDFYNHLNNKHKSSMNQRNFEKTNAIDHL